jgi:hypothetical protein
MAAPEPQPISHAGKVQPGFLGDDFGRRPPNTTASIAPEGDAARMQDVVAPLARR